MSSKVIGVLLSDKYIEKFKIIVKREYSDQSKLVRKWIDENFKEEYAVDLVV